MAFDTGTTGGVDEPSLDGMEIDDRDEVDETGDGIAMTLVVIGAGCCCCCTLLVVVIVLVVGANKFDIVGECFLLLLLLLLLLVLLLLLLDTVVVVWLPTGDTTDGDDTIVACFVFGDESDVLVHVVGNLLLFTVVDAAMDAFPFGIVAVVVLVC